MMVHKAAWPTIAQLLCAVVLLSGCNRAPEKQVQGYVEGDYVYVASPLAGALETLNVQRGEVVKSGDALFSLESASEKAARNQAEHRLAQARATLADARKGKRPSEIDSLNAQLDQTRTELALAEKELARQEDAARVGATPVQDLDRARSARDQDRQRIAQLEADLTTAKLGLRPDQISAAEADVRMLEAALAKADWDLSQKKQAAPQAGMVFDTLYQAGEWVAAGHPVVVLLPPANLKVRAFVPERQISAVQMGQTVRVLIDGASQPISGKVTFVSPKAEYTPPVIYSRESREKLVFMIEIHFDPADAAHLHPGQPVDVQWGQ